MDYTCVQTGHVEDRGNLPSHAEATAMNEQAQEDWKKRFKERNRYNHVKATNMASLTWVFNDTWESRVRSYPFNQCTFYHMGIPVGWATFEAITRYWIRGRDGMIFQGPLESMTTFEPANAR